MQSIPALSTLSERVVKTIRQLFEQPEFCHRHRSDEKAFTRRRALSFVHVMVFLLQKTVRSIQLHLHEFFESLGRWSQAVTSSAWSQARLKLKHTAFIELNERAVLAEVYGPENGSAVRRWKGHRLLAIDSWLLRLPYELEIGEEFGWVECRNDKGECGR